MLREAVFIAAMLCLLQGRVCLDLDQGSNFTSEVLDVVECFTENVDQSWEFTEEEEGYISHFQARTFGQCDIQYWRIFECNYPLMDQLQEFYFLLKNSRQEERQYYKTEILEHYKNATEIQNIANLAFDNLIREIEQIKAIAETRNETRILNDPCSLVFFDLQELRNESVSYTDEYRLLQTNFQIIYVREYIRWYCLPPFVIVVFICGMIANGVLLLIFIRHSEARSGPNVLLVNLAVSDFGFLIVNIALDYSKQLWGFPFGWGTCYVYNFVLTLITGSSVYSMVALSLSRYVAVTMKPGHRPHKLLTSKIFMLITVWVLSALVAIPDTLVATFVGGEHLKHTECHADNRKLNSISDFIFISFLPLIVITSFYLIASRKLRKSAQNIPGEALGQDKVKMARERGAKILPALAIVFAITYLPFYTFWFVRAVFELKEIHSLTLHVLYHIVYFLFNLNSTLNPIALYLASAMFRNYFNKYFTLGLIKKQNPCEKSS